MKYEGVCCGTCGWFSQEGDSHGDCHHSAGADANGNVNRSDAWWCDKWVGQEQAKAWFAFRAQPASRAGVFESWAITEAKS